jgi:hypothetical protein
MKKTETENGVLGEERREREREEYFKPRDSGVEERGRGYEPRPGVGEW